GNASGKKSGHVQHRSKGMVGRNAEGNHGRRVAMHDGLNVGANSIDFSMNKSLTVRPRRIGVDRHAIEIKFDDVLCGRKRRRHRPRHEIVVRVVQRANRHMSKAVQHAFLDENSARHNKISNALLIGIGCGRSMLRRDARLRHGCAPQGDDHRQQHESVLRAPHSVSTPGFDRFALLGLEARRLYQLTPFLVVRCDDAAHLIRTVGGRLEARGDRTFCASGIAAILAISALSLTTRSSAVPRGANSASHEGALKLGTPDSRSVGMFGMECERTDSATPKATTWPLLIIGKIEAVSNNPKGTSPEAIATAAGAPPR